MEYLNRANNTLTGINRIQGEASNMMNTLRQPPRVSNMMPPPDYPMQNQFYYPLNQDIKETFYDPMQSSDWWIVLILLVVLFIMLYWMNSKKQNENLLL
jgi:hypothetical protein